MTKLLTLLAFLVTTTTTLHAAPPAAAPAAKPAAGAPKIRTFLDCKGLPRERLRNSVSPKFYKQLTISPLDAYIVARAPIHDTTSRRAKIIHSEAGGAYDYVAQGLAEEVKLSGLDRTESRIPLSHIDMHVLIYKIRDAVMAVGFWHVDDPRYAGYRQLGSAAIGFLQNGKWTFMQRPETRR
jgi:hypothetical protein